MYIGSSKGFPPTDDAVIASGCPSILSALAYTIPWAKPCVKARTSLILLQKCGSGVLFSYYFSCSKISKVPSWEPWFSILSRSSSPAAPFQLTHTHTHTHENFRKAFPVSPVWKLAVECPGAVTSGGIPSLTRYSICATGVADSAPTSMMGWMSWAHKLRFASGLVVSAWNHCLSVTRQADWTRASPAGAHSACFGSHSCICTLHSGGKTLSIVDPADSCW